MENIHEYINNLKELLLQININRRESQIHELLDEATKWKCTDNLEKDLLDQLVSRAREFIVLESKMKTLKYTKDEFSTYFTHVRWFVNHSVLLEMFNEPLYKLALYDKSVKHLVCDCDCCMPLT